MLGFGRISAKRFRARWAVLALTLALMACVPGETDLAKSRIGTASKDCKGAGEGTAACFFRNSPVRLGGTVVRLPGRSLEFRPIAEPLEFVDGIGRKWVAPTQTLTDGASIPAIFIPIVGNPRSPEFVNAAAVHDAYCGIGNEDGAVYRSAPWQDVHRVFYDSLIVGGVPPVKAKLMFTAVWLGGPRWHPRNGLDDLKLERLPMAVRLSAMREARTYVTRSDPTFDELLGYLRWVEWDMERRAYRGAAKGAAAPSPPTDNTGNGND